MAEVKLNFPRVVSYDWVNMFCCMFVVNPTVLEYSTTKGFSWPTGNPVDNNVWGVYCPNVNDAHRLINFMEHTVTYIVDGKYANPMASSPNESEDSWTCQPHQPRPEDTEPREPESWTTCDPRPDLLNNPCAKDTETVDLIDAVYTLVDELKTDRLARMREQTQGKELVGKVCEVIWQQLIDKTHKDGKVYQT